MLKHTKLLIAILFIPVLFASCKKNSSDDATPISTWSFSTNVNGILSTADSARGYMLIDSSFGVAQRVFLIDAYCPGKNIVPGFGDLGNSTTLTTLNYNSAAGAQLQYYPSNDTIDDFGFIAASFKITVVDNVNKKVSGEFSGKLVGDVTGDTVVISNGTFTNIPYVIW